MEGRQASLGHQAVVQRLSYAGISYNSAFNFHLTYTAACCLPNIRLDWFEPGTFTHDYSNRSQSPSRCRCNCQPAWPALTHEIGADIEVQLPALVDRASSDGRLKPLGYIPLPANLGLSRPAWYLAFIMVKVTTTKNM